jgi:DNA repair protein RadC
MRSTAIDAVRCSRDRISAVRHSPREVFQAAVAAGAVAVIVAHNHPSGNPSASREDREVTERLVRAGELLGIRLLDSVVVTDPGYVSLRETDPKTFDGLGQKP